MARKKHTRGHHRARLRPRPHPGVPDERLRGGGGLPAQPGDRPRDRRRATTWPRVFERWEDLLEQAKPDIVVIASPPHLHREIALRALGQGAHVLCEKPLAMTAAEGRDMVEAARAGPARGDDRVQLALHPGHAALPLAGGGGRGGPALPRRRAAGSARAGPTRPRRSTWRMDRAQAGHGAMGDMGVHVIDLVRWHFGEFARVTAQAGVAYPSRSAPGRQADRRGGLLQRAGRAGLRRAGDASR